MTVYVSIGNSDDRLPQGVWASFCQLLRAELDRAEAHVHGEWYSLPMSAWQNACWCVEIHADRSENLRERLRLLARTFGQDAITWAEAMVEMLAPVAVVA